MVGVGPEVYLFSLLAAALWGMNGVVAKRGLAIGGSPLLVALYGSVFGTVVFWTVAMLLNGTGLVDRLTPTAVGVFLLSGLVGTAAGRLFSYTGVDRLGATITQTVNSSNPLVATILALFFIGEPVRTLEFLGMLVVIAGLVTISLSRGGDVAGWEPRELVFPLGSALAFGAGNTIRRYGFVASEATPIEGTALNATAGLVGIATFIVATRRTDVLRTSRRANRYFVVAGMLVSLGLLSLMTALSVGRVVVVVPIAGTMPLFTLVFSYLLLGDLERITGRVVLGSVFVVAGIYLLTSV